MHDCFNPFFLLLFEEYTYMLILQGLTTTTQTHTQELKLEGEKKNKH